MSFESLIRRIPLPSYQDSSPDHYLYDPAQKQRIDKLPFFRPGRMHAYQIAVSQAGERGEQGELGPILISGTGLRGRIQFYVRYRAWVQAENLDDLLGACADEAPAARLAERLVALVQHVVARQPDVFDGGDQTVAEGLLHEAEQLAQKECGLHAILSLRPEESIQAPAIVTELEAYSSDYPGALRMRVEVESAILHRDVPLAGVTLRNRPDSYLQELVAGVTREVVRELPTAQLRVALHSEVKRRLAAALEKALAPHYLRIRAVRLSLLGGVTAPPEGYDAELSLQIPLRGHRSDLPLRVQLHLQRADESAYWRGGAPALATWVNHDARRAIARLLAGVTFSQLCLERQRWEAAVTEALRVAASAIGYELTADVALPPAPTWLLAPFSLEVRDIFDTAANDVRTELTAVLRVKLDHFECLRPYLDRGDDIHAKICELAREEIAVFLHQLQPGYLFTAFSRPAAITAPPGVIEAGSEAEPMTVERQLRERVSRVLERNFQARTLQFTARLGASSLRERYDALLGATRIEFEVMAKLSRDAEEALHRGALVVTEVAAEDWATFERRQPTLEEVAAAASDAMKTLIEEHTDSLRFGLSPEALRELAQKKLPGVLRALLGLTVQCPVWNRYRGDDDAALNRFQAEIRNRQYADRLAEFEMLREQMHNLKRRLTAAESMEDDEEVEELTRKIHRLQSRLSTGTSEPRLAIGATATATADHAEQRRS